MPKIRAKDGESEAPVRPQVRDQSGSIAEHYRMSGPKHEEMVIDRLNQGARTRSADPGGRSEGMAVDPKHSVMPERRRRGR